jgi:hypothetical protein
MTITDEERQGGVRCPGYEEPPLPRGFMMAVAQNMHAMETYAALSKDARERLLYRASQTRPGEPMRRLVEHMTDFIGEI